MDAAVGAGATVLATGRDGIRLQAVAARQLPGRVRVQTIIADLSQDEGRARLAEECPILDGIVLAAGRLDLRPIRMLDRDALHRSMSGTLDIMLLPLQALMSARKIADSGSVVWVGSVAGSIGAAGHGAYGGAKAAVEAISRTLAVEVCARGIRSNVVCPAEVDTPMLRSVPERGSALQHDRRYLLGPGRPADVAASIVFLLSDAARWITGTTLCVDGGFTASRR